MARKPVIATKGGRLVYGTDDAFRAVKAMTPNQPGSAPSKRVSAKEWRRMIERQHAKIEQFRRVVDKLSPEAQREQGEPILAALESELRMMLASPRPDDLAALVAPTDAEGK